MNFLPDARKKYEKDDQPEKKCPQKLNPWTDHPGFDERLEEIRARLRRMTTIYRTRLGACCFVFYALFHCDRSYSG
ncbi:MAG: hypothetical protein OSA89_09105 [Mariniblastus sp.]|nr:hypothetical protein [Mariniblastus sp.]